jgi:hypothetical protein
MGFDERSLVRLPLFPWSTRDKQKELTILLSQDPYLKYMADHFEVTVVSIGYRLAPEDPWPAGAEDCYDAAEWLVKNGPEVFGGELMFTGGEVCTAPLRISNKQVVES